jgi:transposase
MLRSVEKEGHSVKHASETFGFSRPAFYQAQSQFKQGGVTGLAKKRPGPKSAHKLTDDILSFIEEKFIEGKPLRARKLAPLIKEKFGKDVHPRTIERAVAPKKKKGKMKVRKYLMDIESVDSTLLQYESLRSQVLNRQGDFSERGLGLTLFIRRGMLAWLEVCHRCMPADSNQQKRTETPAFRMV